MAGRHPTVVYYSGGSGSVKIVVTVKLVPDPNAEKKIDAGSKRLVRTGIETVLNPYDEYAIEGALKIKESLGGDTTVTIFSMAPAASKEVLRKALAMGADDAVLLTDPALEGSDVRGTAYAMAQGIKQTGFDLVICGGLADDGSTGGVPGALAEYLGVPGFTNCRQVEVAGGTLKVQRETDSGYQVVSGPLPALVSVTMAIGEPRYASLKGIMGAKKKSIATLALAALSVDGAVGGDGAKTEVRAVAAPPVREKARVVEAPDGAAGARAIFDLLKEKKLV
ncbi:electron transfer flavoprotein beta subunit/FixA family protein [bacterium]|nr:MAG: electron transfer flavoprotein beta subunit/FixA family protein [bacterium]